MFSRAELKEITSISTKDGHFVSLYLNVDPMFNKKGDYIVHFKNMIKEIAESLNPAVYKTVKGDIEKIESYVLTNKRMFKKGLALLSSVKNSFWKEYHLNVPVKNELIIDKTPHAKPLMDILDNYQRYAILLVDKESARIFVVHLGEIVEFGEVHTPDIPGKHKKGGWFALSQNHYERHMDFHINLHLNDVVEKFDSFLSGEYIGRVVIGGSDETVSLIKGKLHKTVLDKVIAIIRMEMFAKSDEVLNRVEPVLASYEKKMEEETVETLIARAMKNENAVLGLDNVLNALQERKVMKLIFIKDYKSTGYGCRLCGFLTAYKIASCIYCKAEMECIDYIIDMAGQKAIQQGALIEVIDKNKKLLNAGGIGAFLRY